MVEEAVWRVLRVRDGDRDERLPGYEVRLVEARAHPVREHRSPPWLRPTFWRLDERVGVDQGRATSARGRRRVGDSDRRRSFQYDR